LPSYWFPGDLFHYITRLTVPEGTQTRLTATILTGAPATLSSRYAADLADLLASVDDALTPEMDCASEGFYATDYQEAPEGEIYVGLRVEVDDEADLQDLVIGLAEVQIRSAS